MVVAAMKVTDDIHGSRTTFGIVVMPLSVPSFGQYGAHEKACISLGYRQRCDGAWTVGMHIISSGRLCGAASSRGICMQHEGPRPDFRGQVVNTLIGVTIEAARQLPHPLLSGASSGSPPGSVRRRCMRPTVCLPAHTSCGCLRRPRGCLAEQMGMIGRHGCTLFLWSRADAGNTAREVTSRNARCHPAPLPLWTSRLGGYGPGTPAAHSNS